MIALDTNFLVYAHRSNNSFHTIARTAISRLINDGLPWGVPIACVHEFLAVVTNPRIFKEPTPRDQAFTQIDVLLSQSGARLLVPTEKHLGVLRGLATRANAIGAQMHDARIAALCIENGVTQLWSADRDFSAYDQLQVRRPEDLVKAN
jgi:uncharacterized protein